MWMVFGLRGEPLICWDRVTAPSVYPRFQYAVALQPQVVVHVARGVLLNHEQQRPAVGVRISAAGSGSG